jgi:hypothetical protein
MDQVDFSLGGKNYSFPAQATRSHGAAETLFVERDLFGGDAHWRAKGFAVVDLLSADEAVALAHGMARRAARDLVELQPGLSLPQASQAIIDGRYHTLVASDEIHRQLVRRTANYKHDDLPLPVGDIYRRLGQQVKAQLSELNPKLPTEIVTLRLSRPRSLDFNPPHKDVYLDFYRGTLNVWLPLLGCTETSTLPVVPGSHLWPEDQIQRGSTGNLFNNLRFNVPIVFSGPAPLAFVRPPVRLGQALVFTPNLVHGVAMNLAADTTRMSLELRPVWSL